MTFRDFDENGITFFVRVFVDISQFLPRRKFAICEKICRDWHPLFLQMVILQPVALRMEVPLAAPARRSQPRRRPLPGGGGSRAACGLRPALTGGQLRNPQHKSHAIKYGFGEKKL